MFDTQYYFRHQSHLAAWRAHAQDIRALQQTLHEVLPEIWQNSVTLDNINDDGMAVLAVDSGVLANRLRHMSGRLQAALAQCDARCRGVIVRVRPPAPTNQCAPTAPERQPMSAAMRVRWQRLLDNLSADNDDSGLKTAISKLLQQQAEQRTAVTNR